MQQDWSGYVVCDSPYGYAQRQISIWEYNPAIVPLNAIIPKFFGFYEPVEDIELNRLGPILLIEDCAVSVETFKDSLGMKRIISECWNSIKLALKRELPAMYATLAAEGIIQRSVGSRNITIQPGLLCIPLTIRSYDRPSLRLIDFGRICVRDDDFITWDQPIPIPMLDRSESEEYAEEYMIYANRMVRRETYLRLQPAQGPNPRLRIRFSWEKAGLKKGKDGKSSEREWVYVDLD